MTIIDQINIKASFRCFLEPEQFSCGLLFEPGACLLDNFPQLLGDVSRKKEKVCENYFPSFIQLKFVKSRRIFALLVEW